MIAMFLAFTVHERLAEAAAAGVNCPPTTGSIGMLTIGNISKEKGPLSADPGKMITSTAPNIDGSQNPRQGHSVQCPQDRTNSRSGPTATSITGRNR